MKKFIPKAWLIVFLLSYSEVRGQVFTEYLTGRPVHAIVADPDTPWVWFGTENFGLSRFDGTRFEDYNANNSALRDNFVRSLARDHNGNLWVGTNTKGVGYFKPIENTWAFFDTSNGLVNNKVNHIAIDARGWAWFATDGGVGFFDGTNWYRYTTTNYARHDVVRRRWEILKTYTSTDKGLTSNEVNTVAIDTNDTPWVGTGRGASMLKSNNSWETFLAGIRILTIWVDRRGEQWFGTESIGTSPSFFKASKIGSTIVMNQVRINCLIDATGKRKEDANVCEIINDNENNLWVATIYGTFRYDPVNMTWRCSTGSRDLDDKFVEAMAIDRDGNLWFGSVQTPGATKYTANWVTFSTIFGDNIRSDEIFALTQDRLGQTWIGTKLAIARYDSNIWHPKAYFGDASDKIQAIKIDTKDNTLWVGSFGGGVLHIKSDASLIERFTSTNPAGGPINDQIFSIAVEHNAIWAGTTDGLSLFDRISNSWQPFTVSNTNRGLLSNQIEALAIDLQDQLWVGTPRGLSRYNGTWINFTTENTPQGLESNSIKSITVDQKSGRLWFGTLGGGASTYLDGKWQKITPNNGLADNFVEDIIVLNDRREIWFATGGGVSCYDSTKGQWTTYTIIDGLADNHVTSLNEGVSEEEIWFGTRADGVTRYRRQKVRPNTKILDPIDVTTQPEMVFRFLGNDLNTSRDLLRYSYKLDNESWSDYISDTFARLTITAVGLHTFYVKAIDRDGNEDQSPAAKSFYKVDPAIGTSSTFTDTSKTHGLDSVKVKLYWPPYQLPLTLRVTLVPIAVEELKKKDAILAYDLIPSARTDIRQKGVILTFEFPLTAKTPKQNYFIDRDIDADGKLDSTKLGGTQTIDQNLIRITTGINQFGRYVVRSLSPYKLITYKADSVNAQPRIISPRGGGHGPQTTLTFLLKQSAHVKVKVYNLAGRLVNTICNETLNAGVNAVVWSGRDYHAQICPTGLYILTIESTVLKAIKKVMVLNE